MAFVSSEFRLSERTACKLLGVERSSYRYEPRPDRNTELREELVKLARQKPRYGYRRLHALLSRRGYEVNVKRVYRLYVEERLMVRRKRRKRLVRARGAEPRLTSPNQEWAMDFIVDGLATGRMVRILSVVDAYTRECLALEADTSLGSGRVTRVLERVIAERGRPENVRSDNGPEFTSRRMIGWAEDWKVGLVHIQPGRPMQNGHVESFHGRLRDECLNATWFRTLNDVRCTLATWREEYNCERPHSSLDYRTPQEFRQQLGYADVESIQRFPHPHSLGGGEIVSTQNKTEKLQLSMGEKRGQVRDLTDQIKLNSYIVFGFPNKEAWILKAPMYIRNDELPLHCCLRTINVHSHRNRQVVRCAQQSKDSFHLNVGVT